MYETTEILGIPSGAALAGFGVLLGVAGVLLIRRLTDPGPLARGDARWRYRDRDRRDRMAATLDTPILPDRTRGWWLTRIEFALAIGAPVTVALLLVALPVRMGGGSALLLPTTIAGLAGMSFGLWWMRRIYRTGTREDARSEWRYRDR